jgi:tripartite-type tricarboxylate transporter receptor subunit TctC
MGMSRRRFLKWAAATPALAAPSLACAQSYPTRPVRIVTGFAAGGPGDILMRVIGQWLTERLGQPFVIENRTGASGNLAVEAVTRAPPDGYTLLQIGPSNTINATINVKTSFNFVRDIVPVASIVQVPSVMEISPSIPAMTLPEFIAYAKANPGKLSMGSSGVGAAAHMMGELFKMMTDIDMVHVPYRGVPLALADLLGGQVHVLFDSIQNSIEHIRSGKVRALGVTTTARSAMLPHVPTIDTFVPGYEVSSVYGLAASANVSAEIVNKLNSAVNAGLADPKIKARLADFGGVVLATSPTEFPKLIAAEIDKWAKVVKFVGAKPG